MNREQFNKLASQHNFEYVEAYIPFRWIGQGYGFKVTGEVFDAAGEDEVVYISELQMESLMLACGTGEDVSCKCWTKGDFIEMCKGDEAAAGVLFRTLDWQNPDALLSEEEEELL